jgi:hypothetical protein
LSTDKLMWEAGGEFELWAWPVTKTGESTGV